MPSSPPTNGSLALDADFATNGLLTNNAGRVTVESNKLKKPRSGTTFTITVTGVVLSGWTYDSADKGQTAGSISVP
jgi:hypothetical protein